MGGEAISEGSSELYDFARLERAVQTLVEKYRSLQGENAMLRGALEEREGQIRTLDGEMLELNQRRQDVAKRVDDLIAQIEQLDARFGADSAE